MSVAARVAAPTAPEPVAAQTRSVIMIAAAGMVAVVVSAAVAVTIGPADISVADVVRVIIARLGHRDGGVGVTADAIVWELRLPRVLVAALCGAGLGICGVILQSLMRNPLADPFVLGIASGASTGAVLVAVLGFGGMLTLSGGAFLGALAAFALVVVLAGLTGGGADRIMLAGVAGTQLFAALTSFIVFSSADAQQTRGVLFWLLGSFGGVDWYDVICCAVVCGLTSVVCLSQSNALDAFAFGEHAAAALGVAVGRVRVVLLGCTALLTAVLVSVAGAIGFVGLVLPHAARLLVGASHARLIPVVAVAGAVFMVWVDAAARTIFAPQELPIGVLTALIGVPVFVLILLRRWRNR
ncbi:FecCD family ABC transporter permease [Mycobacterium sp. NPDC003323]